jgi:hypothetical protein
MSIHNVTGNLAALHYQWSKISIQHSCLVYHGPSLHLLLLKDVLVAVLRSHKNRGFYPILSLFGLELRLVHEFKLGFFCICSSLRLTSFLTVNGIMCKPEKFNT